MFNIDKDYISVALSEETLKLTHIKGSGTSQKIVNIARRDIKDMPEEELSKVAQAAVSSFNLKKASAICVIASGVATTKNIEIPSVDPEEIKSIVDLQAGRHTPYSREEILIGYINIGVYQRNYTKVLLIIVNRQIIKKQLMVFEQAGLKIEKVIFGPEAKARFYGNILNLKEDDVPVGIIDISKFTTDFTIEFNNTVIACRNIPLGMENILKEGAESRDKLIDELVKSVDSYQSEDINKTPETYLLTLDDAKVKDLQPLLQERLKANVKVVPYLDHVTAIQPVMLKIVSEFDDESFLDIAAPISVLQNIQVDLMPDEVKDQRSIEEKGRQVVKAGIFAMVMLVLVCAMFFTKIYFRNKYLSRISKEYTQKRKAVEELERISTNTRIVQNYLESRMLSLDVIDELYRKIPDEIYLKNITLDEEGAIRIQGISESRSTAFAFITILENSDLFKNAKMISSNAQKDRGKDVSSFEISFKLESAKDDVEEEEAPEEELVQEEGEE